MTTFRAREFSEPTPLVSHVPPYALLYPRVRRPQLVAVFRFPSDFVCQVFLAGLAFLLSFPLSSRCFLDIFCSSYLHALG